MPGAKKNLVIVESPAKAKTIEKYLGDDYKVVASMGHLRDLPKSTLGIDIENDFEPKYIPVKDHKDVIDTLKKLSKSAKTVYLATDPDREGEAISWHLKELLALPDDKARRVTFNEITKKVVTESVGNPRDIDKDLVDAQQARRLLDRLVGYKLSPLLWKKIKRGLSAGRVQSVATRMVVDREKEIEGFVREEYWLLDAVLNCDETDADFTARYYGKGDKKLELHSEDEVNAVIAETQDEPFVIKTVKRGKKHRSPSPPFITKETGLEIYRLGNDDLTYEKKHELNLGLDMGFLNNRINVTFDWYRRNNYDLIGPKRTVGIGGEIYKYANVASMRSHGEELTISTRNIETKDFKWSTDFIFYHSKNTVTDLDSRANIMQMITGTGFTMNGYPVRSLFSIDFKGLNNKGLPIVVNQDGEETSYGGDLYFQSTTTDYLKYEGPTDPTVNGSFGNTFSYKGLKLNVFITYAAGNKVRLDPAFSSSYSDMTAMPKEFINRWTQAGDEAYTDVPVIADQRMKQNDNYIGYLYNAYNYSTARVAKGDFIRMKEISLAYDFPGKWIQALRLNSVNLKLQATNLFLIYSDKKLHGQDPEFFNTGGVATPMPRQFTLTLRVGL